MAMKTVIAAALLLLSTAVAADTRATMERNRALYERHAGAEVDEIRSWKLYDWLPLGSDALAVWTRPNAGVYLIEVDQPCRELEYAKTIGVTSTTRTVSRKFDRVNAGRDSCGIVRIREVDHAALRAEQRAARD